ncbi:MAG: hypothetical protein WD896_01230, partial [Parcubacteria group bacterium]
MIGWKRRCVMEKCTWTSQVSLDEEWDKADFAKAFATHFPGGEAEEEPVAEGVDQGYMVFYLHVPVERKRELAPFLKEYAETHSAFNEGRPAGNYPFSLFP